MAQLAPGSTHNVWTTQLAALDLSTHKDTELATGLVLNDYLSSCGPWTGRHVSVIPLSSPCMGLSSGAAALTRLTLDILLAAPVTTYTANVGSGADLQQLQQVVGKYVDQYHLVTAAGPMTAAMAVRLFVGKNKLVSGAVTLGTSWFAIRELTGPAMNLVQDQFGNLQSLLGSFR